MSTKHSGQCPECQRPITITVEDPQIFNGPTCAVIAIPHLKPTICACGREFVPKVGHADIQINGLLGVVRSNILDARGNSPAPITLE